MAIKTNLPSRYEIRPLTLEHLEWTKAVLAHSFMFGTKIWHILYSENKTARFYEIFKHSDHLIRHQIESGLSLGVFDSEYQFRRPEAASSGGKAERGGVYFDFQDTSVTECGLLEQMDNPLVSIAGAFDLYRDIDHEKIGHLVAEVLPAAATFFGILESRDGRAKDAWVPNGPGQVIQRLGTATRLDATKNGFMAEMARYMMRLRAEEGFRGIQIECFHDAVDHVWANPPEPFKAETMSELLVGSYYEAREGQKVYPYSPVDQRLTKVYVTLK